MLTEDRARLESELQHTSQLYDQEKRLHTSASQAAATLRKRADDLERLLTEKQNELLATQRDLQIMGEKLVDEIERVGCSGEVVYIICLTDSRGPAISTVSAPSCSIPKRPYKTN